MENKLFRNSVSVVVIVAMFLSIFALVGMDSGAYAGEKQAKVDAVAITDKNVSDKVSGQMKSLSSNVISPLYKANSKKNKITYKGSFVANKNHYINFGGDGIKNAPVDGGTFFIPRKYTVVKGKYSAYKSWDTDVNALNNNAIGLAAQMRFSPAGKWKMTVEYDKKQWFSITDVDGQVRWSYDDVTSGMKYTATKIIDVKGTVTFSANKGKLKKKSSRTKYVSANGKAGKLPKVTRKGYKFKGWYTQKKGGKKITKSSKVKFNKVNFTKVTYYAHWTKK